MANLQEVKPKKVVITLSDGIERELRFTLNAMAELEERYGSVDAAFKALDGGSFKAIRCVLWAGLMESDETLTEQKVGSLLDVNNMQELTKSMEAALKADMPSQEAALTAPNA